MLGPCAVDDPLALSLTAWLRVSGGTGERSTALVESDHASLEWRLPRLDRWTRRCLGGILQSLPPRMHRSVTTWFKRGRNDTLAVPAFPPNDPLLQRAVSLVNSDRGPLRPTVCLTHDVDTSRGLASLVHLLEPEIEAGFRSAVNFLTRGPYLLDRGLLSELGAEGFELGLHGDSHDPAFGLRPVRRIRKRLSRAVGDLGFVPSGFRAPARSYSRELAVELDRLGFRYDSSIPMRGHYRRGIAFPYPFLIGETSLWELPLGLQDDGLFRDGGLSNAAAVSVVEALLRLTAQYGGLLVFNTHPSVSGPRRDFYREVLSVIRDLRCWVIRPCDLVGQLDKQLEQSLIMTQPATSARG